MSDAILEMVWPARGGGLSNGSFETDPTEWSAGGSGDPIKQWESAPVLLGSHSASLHQIAPNTGYINLVQQAGLLDYYRGKQITVFVRALADRPGASIILRFAVNYFANIGIGTGGWEYFRISKRVPDDATQVKIHLYFSNSDYPQTYVYFDCAALVLGDTYSRIEIDKCHVFPVSEPEQVASSTVTLADGSIAGVEDSLVIIDKEYSFRGITNAQYKKLRNFQRYVCCGLTYEFDYTDIDGETYKAQMLPSFADSLRIAPDRWNTTMKLRLTDRGIA